jgi:TRAP-type transport system small permease protein
MKRSARILARVEEILAASILVTMSAATFLNVIARYVFNSPFDWAEEFSRYAFIWLVFMGAVVATTHRRHIVIDLVITSLPRSAQTVCRVLADLVTLALMAAMAFYGWMAAQTATSSTATLGVPRSWVYMSAPVAGVLIFCHTLVDLATGAPGGRDGGSRS